MKTVLITGSSSGIGRETARYFHQKGWQVIATMRHPEKRQTELHQIPGIVLMHTDVTDLASVQSTVRETINKFKTIDVLVNNAGYSLTGLFENATIEQIQQQYQTNVFGLMAMTREVLPFFRKQKYGTLINVASIGGRIGFPLYSLYNSTKWAVEGFSEALHHELKALNIRVKIIEPGIIKTDFYDRSMVIPVQSLQAEYGAFAEKVLKRASIAGERGSAPSIIARLIYRAATDGSWKLRYAAGQYAKMLLFFRRIMPDAWLQPLLRQAMQ